MVPGANPFVPPPELRDPARRLRGRLAAPVTLWTAGAEEASTGLTVSSIVVAEGEPAEILGLINPLTDLFDVLNETRAFVVHVLARGQRRLAERFAGAFPHPEGLFAGEPWEQTDWGPALVSAEVRAFCRFAGAGQAGYHRLVRGLVERVEVGEAIDPLVYLQGRFRVLEPSRRPD